MSRYDGLGRLRAVWLPTEEPDGEATYRYDYAPDQRPARVTSRQLRLPGQYLDTVAYHDGFGREVQSQTSSSTRGQRTLVSSSFDGTGQLQRESAPYDAEGEVGAGFVAPAGDWSDVANFHQFTYDALDIEVADDTLAPPSGGGAPQLLWRTSVEVDGWVQRRTDERGTRVDQRLDAFGQLVEVTEFTGEQPATTTYAYDAAGEVTSATDAAGNTTRIGYDLLGWKASLDDPDQGAWGYDYDDAGNLVSQTDARGQTLWFGYDAGNRLVERRADGPDGELLAAYDHDAEGRLGLLAGTTSFTDAGEIEVRFDHDARNRVVGQEWVVPGEGGGRYAMAYTFDAADVQTSMTYPGDADGGLGERVVTAFDAAGRPRSLTGDGGQAYVDAMSYDAQGQVVEQQLVGGAVRRSTYDPRTLRLSAISATADGEQLQDLAYTYDEAANVTAIADGANAGQTQCFAYDDRSRLTRAFTGSDDCATPDAARGVDPYDRAYTYDPIGNLTSSAGRAYAYDDPAHPRAVTGAGSDAFAYDANGNQTQRTVAGAASTLGYDADNRMTGVSGDGADVALSYDADGQRVVRRDGEVTTVFVGDSFEVAVDGDGGARATSFYAAGEQRVAMRVRPLDGLVDGGEVHVLLGDHLGSTSVAWRSDGGETLRSRYDPWGLQRPGGDRLPTDRTFTGETRDVGSGLVYLSARYYDPLLGRFIQHEPGSPKAPHGVNFRPVPGVKIHPVLTAIASRAM